MDHSARSHEAETQRYPGNSGNNKPCKVVSDRLSLKYFSNLKAYQTVNLPRRVVKMWLGTPLALLRECNRTPMVRGTIAHHLTERTALSDGGKNYCLLS